MHLSSFPKNIIIFPFFLFPPLVYSIQEDAERFLETHFPVEIVQAYRALIPGALKADLFRYCALLIHGGVYADVDLLLESNLDAAIRPDIGFAVPKDAVRVFQAAGKLIVEGHLTFSSLSALAFSLLVSRLAARMRLAGLHCGSSRPSLSGQGHRNCREPGPESLHIDRHGRGLLSVSRLQGTAHV